VEYSEDQFDVFNVDHLTTTPPGTVGAPNTKGKGAVLSDSDALPVNCSTAVTHSVYCPAASVLQGCVVVAAMPVVVGVAGGVVGVPVATYVLYVNGNAIGVPSVFVVGAVHDAVQSFPTTGPAA